MIGSLIKTMADAQKLSIQQIVKGVQMGSIPAYIGVPLIEKKTKEAQKLQMAQAALREQGEPPTTVGDQVMQAAGQVTRPENPPTPPSLATDRQRPAPSMGIDSADSNMPQEYAGGGIVAFADQGLVNLDDSGLQEPIPGTTKRVQNVSAASSDDPRLYNIYPTLMGLPGSVDQSIPNPKVLGEGIRDISATSNDSSFMDKLRNWLGPADESKVNPAITPEELAQRRKANPPPLSVVRDKGDPTGSGIVAAPKLVLPQSEPQKAPEKADGFGFNEFMENMRSGRDRDELRNMILGQKADRTEQEAENRNIAMMKAGFGMMAGESPFAGVNIGRGAMLGAESYGKGLEQLRKDDRTTIQQLVNLGLKGQELENEAMKLGITKEYYDKHAPLFEAQARNYEAEAKYRDMMTAMYPQIQQARLSLRAAGAGGLKTGMNLNEFKYADELKNRYMEDPALGADHPGRNAPPGSPSHNSYLRHKEILAEERANRDMNRYLQQKPKQARSGYTDFFGED